MGISKGTKLTDNPKNTTFKVRLDEKTAEKLEIVSKETNETKSEIVRKGIELQYDVLKKKQSVARLANKTTLY